MNKSDSVTVRGSRGFDICLWSLVLFFLFSNSLAAAPDRSFFDQLLDNGKQSFTKGNYIQAETELRQAIAVAGANGASDAQIALAVGNLGSALLSQGRYAEAESNLVRAIAIHKSSSATDKGQLPVLLGNLGKLYQQSGRYKQAESVLREALKLGQQPFADRPMYMADLHNSLGVVHFAMGDKKQAERDFKKAIALATEATDGNPGRTSIFSNLATLYFTQQKWSLAEESLLGSIKGVELSKGPDHPDLCPLLENAGFMYGQKHELRKAETVLRRALAIRQKSLGPESAYTAESKTRLADVLAASGAYEEAGQLYSEALKTQERVLGPQAPGVLNSMEGLAYVLRQTHKEDLAQNMEARVESIRVQSFYTVSVKDLGGARNGKVPQR